MPEVNSSANYCVYLMQNSVYSQIILKCQQKKKLKILVKCRSTHSKMAIDTKVLNSDVNLIEQVPYTMVYYIITSKQKNSILFCIIYALLKICARVWTKIYNEETKK